MQNQFPKTAIFDDKVGQDILQKDGTISEVWRERRRRYIARIFLYVTIISCFVFAGINWILVKPISAWVCFIGGIFAAIFLKFWRGPTTMISHMTSMLGTAVICGEAYTAGGWISSTLWWLNVVVIFSVYSVGPKWGAVWTSICAFIYTVFCWILPYSAVNAAMMGMNLPKIHYYSVYIGLLIVLYAAAKVYLDEQNHMLSALERQNRYLDAARQAAEQQADAKQKFIAHVSHEIRAPMSGMIGVIQLMRESYGDQTGEQTRELRDNLEMLQRTSGATLRILNSVLDFAKTEAGEIELEKIPVDLQALSQDLLKLMSAAALSKGLQLRAMYIPDPLPTVVTDEARLQQILTNLLGNAVKFTAHGFIEIQIRCMPQRSNDQTQNIDVTFAVRDTGIGIAEENLDKIFTPFMQADASTTRRFGGTGLGLSISKNIVEKLGGHLQVTSQIGVGTTFSFTLRCPVVEVAAIPVAASAPVRIHAQIPEQIPENIPAPARAQDQEQHQEPKKYTVLLVDDNEINRLVAKKFLEKLACHVDMAIHGQEAIEKLQQQTTSHSYDLVLMDVQMPVMDGLTATRLWRAQENELVQDTQQKITRRMRIVALTAGVLPEEIGRIRDAGLDDVLAKPIKMDVLAKQLEYVEKERKNLAS